MGVPTYFSFLVIAIIASSAVATSGPNHIHLLRLYTGTSGHRLAGVDCLSWRLAVETNNLQAWRLVPEECENYVGNYILGEQYKKDVDTVADAAIEYAESLTVAADGKDVWIFDLDETSLSNLPYYARADVAFGSKPYNSTNFNAWVAEGKAPALPGILKLYKKLVRLGYKIIFLSGTEEAYRDVRITNLKAVGYPTWEKLIVKAASENGQTAVEYKSSHRAEIEAEGYRIIGNVGDQWSDLLGTNVGNRTFKVPDPMYYIS